MPEYKVKTVERVFNTQGNNHVVDITPFLEETISEEGLLEGTALVFVPGATAGVTTIEFERGVVEDLRDLMEELIPSGRDWKHNAAWGDGNGHSHLRAALVGPSLTVPVSSGRPVLGTWQQVAMVDFDNRPRRRKVVIQLSGMFD